MKSFRRVLLMAAGMFVMTFGIAMITSAGVGTTPISTLPLTVAQIVGVSFGWATFGVNVLFVVLQILVLRSRFPWKNLIQIPVVLLFGLCIDLNMTLVAPWVSEDYGLNFLQSVVSNGFLALGVLMLLVANVTMMPGEGLVLALAVAFRRDFGALKMAFDVALVLAASLLAFGQFGYLIGVREGTLISAFAVGFLIKRFGAHVRGLLTKLL